MSPKKEVSSDCFKYKMSCLYFNYARILFFHQSTSKIGVNSCN